MKIRSSFVTNSSSSSFILAIKDGATVEDVKEALDIDKLLEELKYYGYNLIEVLDDRTIEEVIDEIAGGLLHYGADCSMKLEGWNLCSSEIYSDCLDEYLDTAAIYVGAIKDTDKVRLA